MPPDVTDVAELRVRGARLSGWTAVRVTASLTRVARDFELQLAPPAAGPLPVGVFDLIDLRLGGDLVCRGAIDSVSARGSATGMTMSVRGRSRTAQLVDCSARKPWTARRAVTVAEFAAALAEPYGIEVVLDLGSSRSLKPIEECTVTPCESVFAAIDRYTRAAGVLVTDLPDGRLLITESGRGSEQVLRGGTSVDVTLAGHKLYRTYEVVGQTAGAAAGMPHAGVTASALDERVPAHRYLAIRSEAQTDTDRAQDRALFESVVRAGQALRIRYVVPGWRGETGTLWAPGDTVRLDDPVARIAGDLKVTTATWRTGPQGSETELTLVPRAALPLYSASDAGDVGVDVSALWGRP